MRHLESVYGCFRPKGHNMRACGASVRVRACKRPFSDALSSLRVVCTYLQGPVGACNAAPILQYTAAMSHSTTIFNRAGIWHQRAAQYPYFCRLNFNLEVHNFTFEVIRCLCRRLWHTSYVRKLRVYTVHTPYIPYVENLEIRIRTTLHIAHVSPAATATQLPPPPCAAPENSVT